MDWGVYLESLKIKSKHFFECLEQEGYETKEAFNLLSNSIINDVELTDSEKEKIGDQLKDVLKTIGIIGVAILPAGSVFFFLSTFFKLNKYLLPSAFKEKDVEN